MVLGAGFTNDTNLLPLHQLSHTVKGRLVEGYRIYRQLPDAKLITSGPKSNGVTAQGTMVGRAAIQLGVAPQDTFNLNNPYNTQTEAKYYANRFKEQDTVIIATNALHMRRAMFWFSHFGKTPIPAPTNYIMKNGSYEPDPFFRFSLKYRKILGKVFKEYVGYWYAKWKVD